MKQRIKVNQTTALEALLVFWLSLASVPAFASPATHCGLDDDLKLFLQNYMKGAHEAPRRTTKVSIADVQLKGIKRKEIIVYVSDSEGYYCRSGGCEMVVLETSAASYKVLGDIDLVRRPIRVLSTWTNGHPDLGVWVQGGGIQPGYEAKLKFDGKTYPDNPTGAPAERLKMASGKVVIKIGDDGVLLYP
ncbi:MAG: hypothetical protein ACTHLA_13840 [Asticcacaulis sp.]|uniref:hypothetical protein n=1 Tax=Asticcacaulis sp. TaxID=1872648 RepID=UPI003F7C2A75